MVGDLEAKSAQMQGGKTAGEGNVDSGVSQNFDQNLPKMYMNSV